MKFPHPWTANRAAPSYQLLDLSLAVFLRDGPFRITDHLSFELGALAPSFLGNGLLPASYAQGCNSDLTPISVFEPIRYGCLVRAKAAALIKRVVRAYVLCVKSGDFHIARGGRV